MSPVFPWVSRVVWASLPRVVDSVQVSSQPPPDVRCQPSHGRLSFSAFTSASEVRHQARGDSMKNKGLGISILAVLFLADSRRPSRGRRAPSPRGQGL